MFFRNKCHSDLIGFVGLIVIRAN